MKYIKHDKHGMMPVLSLTAEQIKAGWYEVDYYEELAKKRNINAAVVPDELPETIPVDEPEQKKKPVAKKPRKRTTRKKKVK